MELILQVSLMKKFKRENLIALSVYPNFLSDFCVSIII